MRKSVVRVLAVALALAGFGVFLSHTTPRPTVGPSAPPPVAPLAPVETPEPSEETGPAAAPTAAAHDVPEVDLGLPSPVLNTEAGRVRAENRLCTMDFTKDGVRLASPRGELGWSLRGIRFGHRNLTEAGLLDAASAEPEPQGDRTVSYRRGSVTEAYALRGDGVEQTFILDGGLASLRKEGPLSITVGLRTGLKPVAEHHGDEDVVELRDPAGRCVLTYGGATAIDATGRRQRMSSRLRGADLEMQLDASFVASAAFPITVDPIISLTPNSLTFFAPVGGPNPLPKIVKLKNADTTNGNMKWSASIVPAGTAWLQVRPSKGVRQPGASKNLTVSVNVGNLGAGTYTATISIKSSTASNSPQTVTVTLHVNSGPTILLAPTSLAFVAPTTGPNPVPQSMTVQNVGTGTLNWSAAPQVTTPAGGTWLGVSPSAGALLPGATVTLSVLIDHTGLAAGTFTGAIVVTAVGGTNNPQQVGVTLDVESVPTVVLDQTDLSFDGAAPSAGVPTPAVPPPQVVNLTNGGTGTLTWTLNSVTVPAAGTWLTVSPASGSLNAGESIPLNVSVNQGIFGAGLASGTYTAVVTVTDGTSTGNFNVTFNVNDLATIDLNPDSLTFDAPDIGPNPVPQSVTLSNTGTATLSWVALPVMQSGQTWLSVNPSSGSLPAGASISLSVQIDHTGLAIGTYTASLDIQDTTGTATNPDELVDVTLNVSNTPKLDASTTLLSFQAPDVGPNPASQTFTVSNSGGSSLTWGTTVTVDPGLNWLSVTPTGTALGSLETSTLTVSVDHSGLAVGSYSGTITISAGVAANSPRTVFVTLDVSSTPKIGLSPATMVFDAPSTGANPAPQILTVTNVGGGSLSWSATIPGTPGWLQVSPPSGTLAAGASAPLTVSVDHTGLAVGTYTATIAVSDSNASNSPQTIFVTLNVNNTPKIVLGATSLTFDAPDVGPNPPSQTFSITNGGGGTLGWSCTFPASATWLTVTPASGNLSPGVPDTMTVSVNHAGLAVGAYTATITFSAGSASNSPQTVSVTLNVSATPQIGLSTTTLTFDAPLVGPNPAAQTFVVTNVGGGNLNWTATFPATAWLSPAPTPTTSILAAGAGTTVTVSVDKTGLAAGSYPVTFTITAAGASNSPQTVSIVLNVNDTPKISATPTPLTFSITLGDPNPLPQDFTIANAGSGTLNWTATFPAAATWLKLNPTGGSLGATVSQPMTATVDATGLTAGAYSALITITDPAASNNPQQVSVIFNINAPALIVASLKKAGYCGSVGLDILLPAALLWGFWRLRRKRVRAGASSIALFMIVLLAGAGTARADEATDLPRSLLQQDGTPSPAKPQDVDKPQDPAKTQDPAKSQDPAKPQEPGKPDQPQEPEKPAQPAQPAPAKSRALFNFKKTAIEGHAGIVKFSSDFESSSKVSGGLGVHVPSPLLSGILSSDPEQVAAFLDVTVSSVNRDVTATDTSGTLVFGTLGLEPAIIHNQSFDLRVPVGVQYGYFGGVSGLDNGVAFLVGLRGAVHLVGKLWAVVEPEIAFGSSGSYVFFGNLGVALKF